MFKVFKAAVAQLVEHHVANVNVTSSSLVSRSNFSNIHYLTVMLNKKKIREYY